MYAQVSHADWWRPAKREGGSPTKNSSPRNWAWSLFWSFVALSHMPLRIQTQNKDTRHKADGRQSEGYKDTGCILCRSSSQPACLTVSRKDECVPSPGKRRPKIMPHTCTELQRIGWYQIPFKNAPSVSNTVELLCSFAVFRVSVLFLSIDQIMWSFRIEIVLE